MIENISDEEFEEILEGYNEDFEEVDKPTLVEISRWSVYYEAVYKHIPSGKFFRAFWGRGATEYQEGQNEPWTFVEVIPEVITATIYTKVKDGKTFEGNML